MESEMTATDCLTEIRDAVSDASSIRWSDALLRAFMYSAELEIVSRHPEKQYRVRVANPAPTLLAANGDSFTLTDDCRQAMVHYVAFKCLIGDSDDANNLVLAKDHLRQFLATLGDKQ
jgi:hypothetical protein